MIQSQYLFTQILGVVAAFKNNRFYICFCITILTTRKRLNFDPANMFQPEKN